jgi:hypothetical protein
MTLTKATPQPPTASNVRDAPAYTADGLLLMPKNYREWVYLTSGIDMSYSSTQNPDHSVFDNVFVNPSAYRAFLKTGTWPDKTILVVENRAAESPVSINRRGHTQSTERTGLEVHVKDSAHGGWSFYGFGNGNQGTLFPHTASCYSCHEQHGAVDTTFVQFYPTLITVAKAKNTLSSAYLKELPAPAPETPTAAPTK